MPSGVSGLSIYLVGVSSGGCLVGVSSLSIYLVGVSSGGV